MLSNLCFAVLLNPATLAKLLLWTAYNLDSLMCRMYMFKDSHCNILQSTLTIRLFHINSLTFYLFGFEIHVVKFVEMWDGFVMWSLLLVSAWVDDPLAYSLLIPIKTWGPIASLPRTPLDTAQCIAVVQNTMCYSPSLLAHRTVHRDD